MNVLADVQQSIARRERQRVARAVHDVVRLLFIVGDDGRAEQRHVRQLSLADRGHLAFAHRRVIPSRRRSIRQQLGTAGHGQQHHAKFLPKDIRREKVQDEVRGRVRVVHQREHRPQRLRVLPVQVLQQVSEGHEGRGGRGERDENARDREKHDGHVALLGLLALVLLVHALLDAAGRGDDAKDQRVENEHGDERTESEAEPLNVAEHSRTEPEIVRVVRGDIADASVGESVIHGHGRVLDGNRVELVENAPVQLDAEREKTDQTDDEVGVLHRAVRPRVVMFGDGEVPLNVDGDEQRWREIDEVVGEEHVQFTGEITDEPHVLLGIEPDQIEVQDAEENVA